MTQKEFNKEYCSAIWHIRHTVFRMRKRGFADWQINGWVPTMAKRMREFDVYKHRSFAPPIDELSNLLRECKESGLLDGLEGITWDANGRMQCRNVEVKWTEFVDERFGKYGEPVYKQPEALEAESVADSLIEIPKSIKAFEETESLEIPAGLWEDIEDAEGNWIGRRNVERGIG